MNAAAAAAAGMAGFVSAPAASILRGKPLPLANLCRIEGFPGRKLVRLQAAAVRSDDSEDEMPPLVEIRKDGRFFMNADFEFDDEDDNGEEQEQEEQEEHKTSKVRSREAEDPAEERRSSSMKPRKSRESDERVRLRKRTDRESGEFDEEARYNAAKKESEPMQLRRRSQTEPPWRRGRRAEEPFEAKATRTEPSLRKPRESNEFEPRKRSSDFESSADGRASFDKVEKPKPERVERTNFEKVSRMKLERSSGLSEFKPLFLGRGMGYNEDEDGMRLNKRHPYRGVQIYLPYNMRKRPHIAILGGGMAGLSCALALEERGVQSTVFDTGKHGLGGRMGTRDLVEQDGKQLVFDHAAQYFTAKDPKFQKLVDQWLAEGAVKEWDGVVGSLKEGEFTELEQSTKYVASRGMRHLADHMVSKARLINVERPCWINTMEPVDGSWSLKEYNTDHGQYDAVIIAHNGKCANRLLGEIGAPLIARQMKRLELSSVWALLAAFDEPLPQPISMTDGRVMDGAFVEGINSLSWMGNNTRKLGLESSHPHCWTFFSTSSYGKKHKVPQESIPRVKAERVIREVLLGAEMALGIPEGTLPVPFYTRVQLWGAALPLNTPGLPCIFDPHSRVGICGDWLLGASLESAALSGIALANHMADFCEKAGDGALEDTDDADVYSVGLNTPLIELDGHDIGQFPGSTTPNKQKFLGRALKWGALVTP